MHFNSDQVKVFRARTRRVNVVYWVVKVSRGKRQGEQERVVLDLIKKKAKQFRTGKVVVYGHTVRKVKNIAQALGCDAYYHDAVGKAGMLGDFMEGKQRVIVATSALGMGVDIPDIRCIIHMDRPRTLLDYAQESGRAGRDGLRSEAVIIKEEREGPSKDEEQTEEEQRLVGLYIEGEGGLERCRRVGLDGYLDGREDRVGCEEGEEPCDVCGGGEEEADEETDGETDGEPDGETDGETDREVSNKVHFKFRQQERQR